jgi:hypothetical protein
MNNIEIIIARFNEDLNWTLEAPFNCFQYIVYNKGNNDNFNKTNVKKIINIENVGKCDHTYLYHITENYDNLSNIIVFFPGSLNLYYKKDKAKLILNNIIKSNYSKAYFAGHYHPNIKQAFNNFKLDKYRTTDIKNCLLNNESRLQKSKIRPYGNWYTYFFGNIKAHWTTMCGIFSIDKRDIIQHPIERYQGLLKTVNTHSNPEAGHYIERSWCAIFYPLIYTNKIQLNSKNSTKKIALQINNLNHY